MNEEKEFIPENENMKMQVAGEPESKLFFRLDGESAERHGAIGYMRADFGQNGNEFWTTWFDTQPHLKTPGFKKEFENIINTLRDAGPEPPFASRRSLEAFCYANPSKELNGRGDGYFIQTQDYSYFFRCLPRVGNYDIYCFAYDNRFLLPELAGKHELPELCYSTLSATGAVIIIKNGESGYYPYTHTTNDRKKNRETADLINERLGVTKAQENAMVIGSMCGWTVPGAKPWNYEQDGTLRHLPPSKNEPER